MDLIKRTETELWLSSVSKILTSFFPKKQRIQDTIS